MGNCNSSKQPSLSPNHIQDRSRNRSGSQDLESKKVVPVNATKEAKCTIPTYKGVEDLRHTAAHANIIIFTYNELRLATKYFRPDKVIGKGGFGTVYKGLIDDNVRAGFKHTRVAVKMLNHEGTQGDREWLAEVNYLGQFDHPNLVKLIGYCCEEEHRLLVYEYMASGCLEKHLFRGACFSMPWSTRLKVALDAAKGLAFLHGEQRPIIYRDFKTSNILLDKDYKAKLSDFGLAKEGPIGDQTHVTTRVMGTYGYAAPEYVMTGHLTSRSDVYGYGVVLLEMLMGRRAIEKSKSGRERNIVELTRPLLVRSRKLLKIIDPRMEGQYTIRILQKVAKLAYQCLSQNPRERPTMSEIVATLESLQSLPDCRAEWIVQNGEKAITLYEAPKGKHGNAATKEKRCREDAEKMQRNLTALYGRSRSEPAIESNYEQTYHVSVDDETRQCGSFTIRNGRENIF